MIMLVSIRDGKTQSAAIDSEYLTRLQHKAIALYELMITCDKYENIFSNNYSQQTISLKAQKILQIMRCADGMKSLIILIMWQI